MGNTSFSPGNNRRSPQKTRVGRLGLYRRSLGYISKFFPPPGQSWVVSQASPRPRTSRFFRRPDLRMHATASIAFMQEGHGFDGNSIPRFRHQQCIPQCRASWVLGSGDGLWCKRFVRARHGLVVHGIRAVRAGLARSVSSRKVGSVQSTRHWFAPLSPGMTRGMRTTEARTGNVRHPLPQLPTQRSPFLPSESSLTRASETNRHDDDPWLRTSRP